MAFDLQNPLSQHFQNTLFLIESDHIPSSFPPNLDFSGHLLRPTVSLISHFSRRFHHPFLSYLATNYILRFLSSHSLPQDKPWILKLVAVSCVSLAMKMTKTEFPLSDIQKDGGIIFDVQTIERMELMILGALQWRMRSITPFSFINFFISFFKSKDFSLHHHQVLKERAMEIIIKAQIELKLINFKPSIIAACALLSASHELYPMQFSCFKKSISSSSYVNEDDFKRCYILIQEIVTDDYESEIGTLSSCNSSTAINVDFYWSSSEGHSTMVLDDDEEKRGLKRRKIAL